jgi:hypothetical protein
MAFVIENQGMGMGIIKTTTFFADGKEFTAGDHFDRARLLFHEYIAQAPCNRDVEFVHGNSMGIDQAMRPGSACELLRVKFKTPRSADSAKEFRDFLIRHFRVKIHCLSLYEEDCSYDSAGGN